MSVTLALGVVVPEVVARAVVTASKRAQDGVSRTLIVTGTVVDGNEGGARATSLLRGAAGRAQGRGGARDDAVRVAAEVVRDQGRAERVVHARQGERRGRQVPALPARCRRADREREIVER